MTRDDLRAELIGVLYAQMIRCSTDAPQAYAVPDGEPVCWTEPCMCRRECAVYQRWLDLSDEAAEASSTSWAVYRRVWPVEQGSTLW